MLKSLYERFLAASLTLTLVDAEHSESVKITPSFDAAGLLSGVAIELLPPTNNGEPVAEAVMEGRPESPVYAGQEQQQVRPDAGSGAVPGAVELDPVTGQPKPKASEVAA